MIERFQNQYIAEQLFIAQSFPYAEGMRYLFSPDSYPITNRQYVDMVDCGIRFGRYLDFVYPGSILEFRLDFVKNLSDNLFVTEVQTDDRGLPAMAIARNSRGNLQPDLLPGAIESVVDAFKQKAQANDPLITLIYPASERFYYAGFYDVARICKAIDPNTTLTVISDNEIVSVNNNQITTIENGSYFTMQPDFCWNFANINLGEIEQIQPAVTKDILLDAWAKDIPILSELRDYIPRVVLPNDPEVVNDKDQWIIKPINGRWSQGIVIGRKTEQQEWERITSLGNGLIAQRFIVPPLETFKVKTKNDNYEDKSFYSRVEGYYVKIDGKWILADILATCTPDLPVHGKRDCIMIPGEIK